MVQKLGVNMDDRNLSKKAKEFVTNRYGIGFLQNEYSADTMIEGYVSGYHDALKILGFKIWDGVHINGLYEVLLPSGEPIQCYSAPTEIPSLTHNDGRMFTAKDKIYCRILQRGN